MPFEQTILRTDHTEREMLNYVAHWRCAVPVQAIFTFFIEAQMRPDLLLSRESAKYVNLLATMTMSSICKAYDTVLNEHLTTKVQHLLDMHSLSAGVSYDESKNYLCDDDELLDYIESNQYTLHSCSHELTTRFCAGLMPLSNSFLEATKLSANFSVIFSGYKQLLLVPERSKIKVLFPNLSIDHVNRFIQYAIYLNISDIFDLYIASHDLGLLELFAKRITRCLPSATGMIKLLIKLSDDGLILGLEKHFTEAGAGADLLKQHMTFDYIVMGDSDDLGSNNPQDFEVLPQVTDTCFHYAFTMLFNNIV
jgi:hypothetical protein